MSFWSDITTRGAGLDTLDDGLDERPSGRTFGELSGSNAGFFEGADSSPWYLRPGDAPAVRSPFSRESEGSDSDTGLFDESFPAIDRFDADAFAAGSFDGFGGSTIDSLASSSGTSLPGVGNPPPNVRRSQATPGDVTETEGNTLFSIPDAEDRASNQKLAGAYANFPGPISLDALSSTVATPFLPPLEDQIAPDGSGYIFNEISTDTGVDAFEPVALDYDPNQSASPDPDPTVNVADIDPGSAGETVLNGTFFIPSTGTPTGAIVVDGQYAKDPGSGADLSGTVDGLFRGGVAQLTDGRIVVGSAYGNDLHAINERYAGADPGVSVSDFIGGGALIISPTGAPTPALQNPVSAGGQNITDGLVGSDQFRQADHSLIGIRNGRAYAIGAMDKNGKALVDELTELGFTAVVKLDGGSKAYFNEHDPNGATELSGNAGDGHTHLGLRVRE